METINYLEYNNYWLTEAEEMALRGTCLKRNYGCVIVKDNKLVSNGYTRSLGCCNECSRKDCPAGKGYELCPSVHAEQMALIRANSNDLYGADLYGADLYLVGLDQPLQSYTKDPDSCWHCKKMIIEAGIKKVFIRITADQFVEIDTIKYLKEMF